MITLYIGKSGAGKDTFLKKQVALGVNPIISYTTRPMREGEVDGVDYNFVSSASFLEMLDHEQLAEWRKYDTLINNSPETWYYGSPWLDKSKDYVGVVTPEGAKNYIKLYGAENIEVVYVVADDDIREERARMRESLSIEEWNITVKPEWDRRLEADSKDFSDEAIQDLANALGHKIIVMFNNSYPDKVTFSWIYPLDKTT